MLILPRFLYRINPLRPKLVWPDDYIDKIICGDALKILPLLPDKCIDVIITDPVWPGSGHKIPLPGREQSIQIFRRAAKEFARIADRVVIHFGMTTDPRYLEAIPKEMPFVQPCWLRLIPASYRGPVMVGADVAYVFGLNHLPGDGTRVFGGECNAIAGQFVGDELGKNWIKHRAHPTPRRLAHVSWLVRRFSRPGDTILDPFCGSGTLPFAAKSAGRHYIGVDIKQKYADYSRERVSKPDLFTPADQIKQPKSRPCEMDFGGTDDK